MTKRIRDGTSASERRKFIEKELSISLPAIGTSILHEAYVSTHNCENLIGSVQIPLGIAGPIQINHKNRVKSYFLPLATTEGALVASISRGCKVITMSGGATVIHKRVGISRAPVFYVNNIVQAQEFIEWVNTHQPEIKQIAENTSHHITFLSVTHWHIGHLVYLRFLFNTQDAMGMNMVTIAVAHIVDWIQTETDIMCTSISGNLCVDKKPNFLNFIEGRGIQVWADITIPHEHISSILKTTSHDMWVVANQKLLFGSILSGSIGANAHAANVLSALFLATGQDIAHIAECSMVVTEVTEVTNGLYVCVYIPDLPVGTVGGGTQLITQKESLSILGISDGDMGKNAIQLAEVIGGAVLAGEISLLAALAHHDLALAHQQLGRGGLKK